MPLFTLIAIIRFRYYFSVDISLITLRHIAMPLIKSAPCYATPCHYAAITPRCFMPLLMRFIDLRHDFSLRRHMPTLFLRRLMI